MSCLWLTKYSTYKTFCDPIDQLGHAEPSAVNNMFAHWYHLAIIRHALEQKVEQRYTITFKIMKWETASFKKLIIGVNGPATQ